MKELLCVFFPIGILYLIYKTTTNNTRENIQQRVAAIEADYARRIADGHKRIDDILAEWKQAKTIVDGFESGDIPDVVA